MRVLYSAKNSIGTTPHQRSLELPAPATYRAETVPESQTTLRPQNDAGTDSPSSHQLKSDGCNPPLSSTLTLRDSHPRKLTNQLPKSYFRTATTEPPRLAMAKPATPRPAATTTKQKRISFIFFSRASSESGGGVMTVVSPGAGYSPDLRKAMVA